MAEDLKDMTKEQVKKKLRYQRDKDREKVKGIFKYYEVPGGSVSFNYRAYKEDQVERYDLVDGQVYEIPLGVAKHLNKNGWYPVHAHTVDENGRAKQTLGKKVRRFGFNSLEFIDIEDLNTDANQLVTVEDILPSQKNIIAP